MLQYLEHYRPTPLESFVVDFYHKHGIRSPQDIDLEMFAKEAGVPVRFLPRPSKAYELAGGKYLIIINSENEWPEQRVELAHELGHVLLHVGVQWFMPDDFRALQEWQANRFAMYALAPTFMIANCLVNARTREQLVSQLAYQFDVTPKFMAKRLAVLERRLRSLVLDQQLARVVAEQRAMYDYSFRHPTNPRIEYLVKDSVIIGRRRRADI
ncbi:ImmA/IrrE family metallo-endopeptidase [Alicyclobacillus macrosporangiidus]|uniref:ImmA/IrrE family metallo-endopeptidase n=1 Tax=Alicyclobacillus macrosporangiidus TaxID=392015 RepID=UPI00068E5DE5|nr:ImmA/IrrE family metallo-endopeptidase [Alicyclobacillus macrosporangiidus]